MERQVAIYSQKRQKHGLSEQCSCVLCNKPGDGEIIDRGAQRQRLLLPQGWQEGIVHVTEERRQGKLIHMWFPEPMGPFGFILGPLCGDCHASALQEWSDMESDLKAKLLQALIVEFEYESERLDRAGDDRFITRNDPEAHGYFNARRAVRMMGRMFMGQRPSHKSPGERLPIKLEKTIPTGPIRHIGTGDIGNPWSK